MIMLFVVLITVGLVLIGTVWYLRSNRVSRNPALGVAVITIAIIAFIAAAQYIQSHDAMGKPQFATNFKQNNNSDTHINTPDDASLLVPSSIPTITAYNTPTRITPTQQPTPISTAQPTPTTSSNGTDMIVYPGAQKTSETTETIIYTTNESAEVVGEWYKSYMQSKNYNVRNYIKATVNDQTTVTITASSSATTLQIVITQAPGSETKIELHK